jgi:hypothetical protein
MAGAWVCEAFADEPIVCYPLNDLHPHRSTDEHCPCNPFWDEGVLVHNAFDGRELIEDGRRKVS